jgi:hypothetical protein
MDLVPVDVDICQRDSQNIRSLRKIGLVGTFVLRGGKEGCFPLEDTAWKIDDFLQSSFYNQIKQSQSANSVAPSSAESSLLKDSCHDQQPQSTSHEERGSANANAVSKGWRLSLERILEDL